MVRTDRRQPFPHAERDRIADLTEPLLKLAVDSNYYEGNPIPRDPSAYRPVRLFPSPVELLATAPKVPGAIAEGLEAATSPAPLTTSKTDDADVTNELSATESLSDETPETQTNLVREREKAEPGTLDDGDETTTDSEGVGTENGSDAEAASEPQQSEVGNAESDESDDHADDSGDGDTAAKP